MEAYMRLLKRRDAAVLIIDALNLDLKAQTEKGISTTITLNRLTSRNAELKKVNSEIEDFLFGG
jgi:hypothetical protein